MLLFIRTEGFVHPSIPTAVAALGEELDSRGLDSTATDDPATFTDSYLGSFDVVVFLSTTGDVLDAPQQDALERFVRGGGGWVGVHAALDTEYGWPFYAELAGARFAQHPAVQPATVRLEDSTHPATVGAPETWLRTDEWYDTTPNPRSSSHVLATVDEATYSGATMGGDHPIAWCHPVGDGQAFVTAMGHTEESWDDPVFVDHVVGGIESTTEPDTCP